MPRCYGTWTETPELAGIVMEHLSGMEVIDSANDARAWSDAHIAAAIDGIARVHGAFAGRQAELCSRNWIGYVQTASGAAEMQPLWSALAAHAAPAFEAWAGASLVAAHRELVETVGLWWPALERGSRTLIHHDFNSRNVGIRRTEGGLTLVAYDWELATVGAPQRDLAELLCFVLPDDADEAVVERWIEHHRSAFERQSRHHVCPSVWLEGFRAAMNDLLVSRLAFYALIHRIRPQAFLPRVIRTWMRLHEMKI
jgi:aminoglycoside phosphotransferase (APT) family kinase protein